MDPSILAAYAVACIALVFAPGPDIVFVLTDSLSKGWRRGVLITCGLVAGIPVHTFLCAAGISIIISESEILFNLVRLAGAAYLLWLAWGAYREDVSGAGETALENGSSLKGVPRKKIVARGFIMNISNPKVILFFLSFVPQFLTPNGMPVWIQICVLGAIFMAAGFVGLSTVAVLAGRFAELIRARAFWVAMKWARVAVFGGIGLLMVGEAAMAGLSHL